MKTQLFHAIPLIILVSSCSISKCGDIDAVCATQTPLATITRTEIQTPTNNNCITSVPTPEYYIDMTFDAGIQFLREDNEPYRSKKDVSLWIKGLYVIDRETAFLYGELGTIRSVILMTEDGGKYWREVSIPQYDAVVVHLLFIKDGIGWAMIAENREGGRLMLWQTKDTGKTWVEVNQRIHGIGMGRDIGFEFIDPLNGKIVSVSNYGRRSAYFTMYITNDGGRTWVVDYEKTLSYPEYREFNCLNLIAFTPYASGNYYGNSWDCSCRGFSSDLSCERKSTTGWDGSIWEFQPKVEYPTSAFYRINVQSQGSSVWNQIYIRETYSIISGVIE